MRNIEKYKDNIENHINVCGLYQEIYKIKHGKYPHDCCNVCDRCYDDCIRWLASSEVYWNGDTSDLVYWKLGNCFRTREEAETKGKEIMETIKKEYRES